MSGYNLETGEGGVGGFRFRLKLDVQDQGGGGILDVAREERRISWKLDNFHGRHMCIVPKYFLDLSIEVQIWYWNPFKLGLGRFLER